MSLALLSDCLPFSSPLTLGQTSDPKRWLFGHLDKAALKKKTLVCFTLKPSSSEGLEKTASLAFMCDRCPGDGGWVQQAVGTLKFTLSLQGAQIEPLESGPAAPTSGPALAAAEAAVAAIGLRLGHAAAGAGAALSATDAVGCTAVLRGRW